MDMNTSADRADQHRRHQAFLAAKQEPKTWTVEETWDGGQIEVALYLKTNRDPRVLITAYQRGLDQAELILDRIELGQLIAALTEARDTLKES